ncbi:MAG: Gfo/Idh/MocA family oxidoreductase [Clostridia bacterium]|nr:Gfo/Idh/MocA family oxidoreductase [Clostridia bacterium]
MKKNIAVIGYGGQGAWHCDKILASDVCALSGTIDIKEARNDAAREKGIKVYSSAQEIFADPSVDAVVIATPNDVHDELAIAALESGKHVICEKPVSLSVCDLDRMLDAADKNGKLFTVHQNRRWDVDFLAVKGAAHSGMIGDVIRIESRIHGSRGIPSDWRCTKEKGGGMILDWGVHLIDQILQIITEPVKSVYCVTTHITNNEVDDGFRLELTFESGKTALIEVGTYNFIGMPRFYMQCKDGTLLLEDWRKPATVQKLKAWCEKDVTPVQNAAGITKTMAPRDSLTLDEITLDIPRSDVHEFYRNFCLAMDGKAQQLIKNKEVRRVMCVMEAAFESAKTKQVKETLI